MNKKGMTLVEIIVAISLISVVMIFLFQVLITVINGNKRNNTKSKTLISKAIVMKAVEHDLDAFGLSDNSGVIDCSNKIENYLTLDSGSINQIIPASARSEDYYCVKLTYNEDNVKNNEGYLLFYQNNNKGFLAYKRGQGNVLETQIVREIDAIPKNDGLSDLIKIAEESDLYSLRINIPIIANDGNNYDLALNYIYSDNIMEPLPEPDEPEEPIIPPIEDNKATIILELNGGTYEGQTNNVTIETQIGNEVQLSIPAKEGYTFKEWTIVSGEAVINANKVTLRTNLVKISATYEESIICGEFVSDPWKTIAECVRNRNGDSAPYNVGDEKEVAIGGTNYTVRIANNSNYDCSLESKTACGFVVEFVDIVEQRAMNSSETNEGGWPATAMRIYLNREFLAKLPSDLQSVIADTTVVSGHGSNNSSNFTSTDKIYLLSTKEVCVDGVSDDTAKDSTITRQLDYYLKEGVTTSKYGAAIKNYAGSAAWWWLRAACSYFDVSFLYVCSDGYWGNGGASVASGGVAPAFRIR